MRKKIIYSTIIIFTLLFCISLIAKTSEKKSISNDIKGKIDIIVGKALIKKNNKWINLSIGTMVSKNDIIKTGKGASVKIKFNNDKIGEIKANQVVKVESLFLASSTKKGSMNSLMKKIGKSYEIQGGPTAVAGVRGADVSKQKKKVKKDELDWKK